MKKSAIFVCMILFCAVLHAQEESETTPFRFTNSESPDISFMVNTNLQDCVLHITTNYPTPFKIRFIDYWGNSVRVYKDLGSGEKIDVSEFKNQIVVLNIMDNKNNHLLSSQVVNLKRRNYW